MSIEEGRILSRWGDAGWGKLVLEDKHNNHFRDELVEALAEMITERWQPDPEPEWVTCVPSINHPTLVPDFAERLAAKLDLPFIAAIKKVKDNQPQKLQQNSYFQCSNLDGVFQIYESIPDTPVLLFDDVIDSGWTMTVIAALLKESNTGPVYPVTLATTS